MVTSSVRSGADPHVGAELGSGDRQGIAATRRFLSRREVSVTEHIGQLLAEIERADPALGAFVSVAGGSALRAAEAADRSLRALGPTAWRSWPLLGVPVAVKDLIQTAELPTSRGSVLPNRRARIDAPAVARLRAAGAVVIGKTSSSEYGWSASTVGSLSRPTRNPWRLDRTAGGSSGGSAAAVATGMCAAALGTDGAGSVRIPASFCGVVGFKPSYGRIPYVPGCPDRLSHLGPITLDVADAIELAAILAGPHPGDPDSWLGPDPGREGRPGLRVGWLEFPGTEEQVRQVSERALPALAAAGHRIERIAVPFADPYPALVDILAAAEAAGTAPADEHLCDPGRLAIVRYGRTVSGAAILRAEQVRLALRITLHEVMRRYDLLAMATVPVLPFGPDAIGPCWAAEPANLLWLAWTPATYPFNITGQPAVSLPAGLSAGGLPVGVQLVGPSGADSLVLSVARQLEVDLGPLPAPPPIHLVEGMT